MQIFVQIQYESLHVDMNSPEGDVDIPSLQPVRFCNLNHESVFRKIFALLFLEALIPPTVDLIYAHGEWHDMT